MSYVVRMPQPSQMSEQMRHLGAAAASSEFSDVDELVKEAIHAGTIDVAWSYIAFDDDALPVATQVAQVTSYGQYEGDPDRVIQKDRYDTPTWHAVRKGRRPTEYPTFEAAEETVEEHLATAKHFGISPGNLKLAQVVDVEVYEASLRKDPTDRIQRRATQVDAAVARRKAEEYAAEADAIEAELSASKPVSAGDWRASDEQRIQMRTRSDGTKWFRARVAGRTSPSYATVQEAIQWREEQTA